MLDTLIDIRVRPDIVRVPVGSYKTSSPKKPDMKDPFDFPPIRPHPNQYDEFFSARDAQRYLRFARASSYAGSRTSGHTPAPSVMWETETAVSGMTHIPQGTTNSRLSRRYNLSEARAVMDNQHPHIDVYVSESNMGFWKVVMEGPPESPYASGTFVLYVEMTEDFPRMAPAVRFITPILHPNITKHGRVCHPIFDREWSSSIRLYEVLQHIWGLLMSIESRDAVDPFFTLKFWTDHQSGISEVQQYIRRFASRNRQQHRAEILSGI